MEQIASLGKSMGLEVSDDLQREQQQTVAEELSSERREGTMSPVH